jgi:hypothetical protein
MDVLNFISWINEARLVKTVDPSKTLLPIGVKDKRRDDEYIMGVITVEDLTTQLQNPLPEE